MTDLIDRQTAIDTLDKHLRTTDVPVSYPGIISALTEWLNKLPSAQADLSGYSDKLWKAAYERGKAEALDEIIHCKDCKHWSRETICDGFCSEDCMRHDEDFYCGYAERKTNE